MRSETKSDARNGCVGKWGELTMYRKNKDSEKTGARARNTPFGAYCYALTNKKT